MKVAIILKDEVQFARFLAYGGCEVVYSKGWNK